MYSYVIREQLPKKKKTRLCSLEDKITDSKAHPSAEKENQDVGVATYMHGWREEKTSSQRIHCCQRLGDVEQGRGSKEERREGVGSREPSTDDSLNIRRAAEKFSGRGRAPIGPLTSSYFVHSMLQAELSQTLALSPAPIIRALPEPLRPSETPKCNNYVRETRKNRSQCSHKNIIHIMFSGINVLCVRCIV